MSIADATDVILESFAAPAWRDVERQWRSGLIGSLECMSRQVALLDASEAELHAVLDRVQIDPAFPGFVALARDLDVKLVIVSDGLDRAIERILANHGIRGLAVVANSLERIGDRRWAMGSPHARHDCRARSGTCKCAWASARQDAGHNVLLIGDGQSDLCVSSRADFVFAKSKLLSHCRTAGLAHRPIQCFEDAIALLPELLAARLRAQPHPSLERTQFA